MNRHFLAGAVILTYSCLIVSALYACVSLDVDSDYKVYTPVGVTASVDAWVYEGGPVDDWDWSWPTGVSGFYSSDSSDSSTSYGTYSSAGAYSIDVAADGPNGWDNATSSLYVVEVDKLQYWDGVTSQWVDITGTLYVHKNDSVQFQAVRNPSSASQWPSGKPVWGGTAGASGTGSTKTITFNTLSSSTSDYKTVTAECGNTATANVIVWGGFPKTSPRDDFTGGSDVRFGVYELVDCECDILPAGLTGTQVGGLRWEILSGVGTLSNITSNGTALYTAHTSAGSVTLRLRVESGPSKTFMYDLSRTIVEPDGGTCVKRSGTNIWHIINTFSIGLNSDMYLTPTDVSFDRIEFQEGYCNSQVAGWFTPKFTGTHHTAWTVWIGVSDGAGGGRILQPSGDFAALAWSPVLSYSSGTFLWSIPWRYRAGTYTTSFSSMNQQFTVNSGGRAEVQKDSSGWFYNYHSWPGQNY